MALTKKKTNDLYEDLECFINDLAQAADDSEDSDEIDILLPILEKAQSLKSEMEPIL